MSSEKFEILADESEPYIGVDEVGRGCLAGPVVAGAVVFLSGKNIDSFVDSKSITETKRSELSALIHQDHLVGLGWASVEEIDQVNILQATFIAMRRALDELKSKMTARGLDFSNATIYIDGRDKIPNLKDQKQRAIIKGDQKLRVISAASIVAKVARDEFMANLEISTEQSQHYGFGKHKGYGTQLHRDQIQKLGPTKWHRRTFAGVKEFVPN